MDHCEGCQSVGMFSLQARMTLNMQEIVIPLLARLIFPSDKPLQVHFQ